MPDDVRQPYALLLSLVVAFRALDRRQDQLIRHRLKPAGLCGDNIHQRFLLWLEAPGDSHGEEDQHIRAG
jgi:hypothetical protein